MKTIDKKEATNRLTYGLLDLIILNYLSKEDTHPYLIISKIRKDFDITILAGTMYPHMNNLEKNGYVKSEFKTVKKRFRKIYNLTEKGRSYLDFLSKTHNMMSKKIGEEPELTEILMIPEMEEATY